MENKDHGYASVCRFGMVIGKPTFVPVQDLEMGFEKMVKIAHSSGGRTRIFKLYLFKFMFLIFQLIAVYKQERIGEKLKDEVSG